MKGARGAGKTTLLLQYANSTEVPQEKTLYVACDHPAMAGISLYEMAQTFFQEGGRLFLVDEVHKAKGFARELKAINDTFDLQVIFSGSSALRIDNELADLSRRAVIFELPILSFREYLEIETDSKFEAHSLEEIVNNHQAISAEVCAKIRPIELFQKYIQHGAYPFYLESKETYMFFALCASPNMESIRETFFVSQLSQGHEVHCHDQGDFIVDEKFIFEIGGPGKTKGQLGKQGHAFVASDEIESGAPWQIPLWVLGMGY